MLIVILFWAAIAGVALWIGGYWAILALVLWMVSGAVVDNWEEIREHRWFANFLVGTGVSVIVFGIVGLLAYFFH